MKKPDLAEMSTAAFLKPAKNRNETAPQLTLTIMAHPVMRRVGDCLHLGESTTFSRNQGDFYPPASGLGQPLADPALSRKPFELAIIKDKVRLDLSGTSTKVRLNGKTLNQSVHLVPAPKPKHGLTLNLADRVVLLLHWMTPLQKRAGDAMGMVGQSDAVRQLRKRIERVVDLDVPVLIRGETGTGKELVATALHHCSPRAKGPLVAANLASIPPDLAAAELFGAQKGAFTGAHAQRTGLFQKAHGGVLFLDEVGEAPPQIQVMLLRTLETGLVQPLGGRAPVPVDVRLVTATDANLETMVAKGSFRAPLLHRLAGYEIHLTPLRHRADDIGRLFCHFAKQALAEVGDPDHLQQHNPLGQSWLPADLAELLVRYSWPGNIRQLRNMVHQLVIDNRGRSELEPAAHLLKTLNENAPDERPYPRRTSAFRKPSEVNEEELKLALKNAQWDLKAAAAALNISRPSLYDLIRKHPDLNTASDLTPQQIITAHQHHGGNLEAMVMDLCVSQQALKRRLRELNL